MEYEMSALQKLQEKIEQWRVDHEALKSENAQLKVELSSISGSQNEQASEIAALKSENAQLKVELSNVSGSQNEQESQIAALKRELEEKDVEIEKIIAQVESLLA